MLRQSRMELLNWQALKLFLGGSVVAPQILADFIDYKKSSSGIQNRHEETSVILLPGPAASGLEFEFEVPPMKPSPPRRCVGRASQAQGIWLYCEQSVRSGLSSRASLSL